VVPVLNEGRVLARSIETLHTFLTSHLPYDWTVVIAENGSRDNTLDEAHRLAAQLPRVEVITIEQPGRGRALRAAWEASDADVVCYTDVDLSTSLDHLRPLVDAVLFGGCDIAAWDPVCWPDSSCDTVVASQGDFARIQPAPAHGPRRAIQ
jgi:glycosyltransferase involved in cell wall biosynthesis